MDIDPAGFFEYHAEASSQLLVEVGYDGGKGFDDGDPGSKGAEDGCEFAADDAASDYYKFLHGMIHVQKLVTCDHLR